MPINLKPTTVFLFIAFLSVCRGTAFLCQAEDRLTAAKRLAEAGKTEQALAELDLFKQLHPKDPRGYLYSAVALLRAGRRFDAEIELGAALAASPSSEEDLLTLSDTLDQLGRPELAAQVLNKRMEEKRLGAEGLWLLSDLQLRLHHADEAAKTLETYSRLKPKDPRTPLRRGQIELMAGRLENALSAFEDARDLNPSDPEALFGMSSVLFQGNNPEAAVKVLTRLLKVRSDSRALHLLGLSLASLGRYPEAVQRLEEAAKAPDCEPRVHFDLGNLRRKIGDDSGARQALARYQELYRKLEEEKNRSQLVVQLLNEGRQELQQGRAAGAEASFRRVLEVEPTNWAALLFLVKLQIASGRLENASQHLDQMRKIAPDSSEARYLTAFLQYRTGAYSEALQQAETAKRLRPAYPELRNLLGNILFALGRPAEALREYEAATKLDPDQPSYRLNYESLAKSTGS